MNRYGITLKNNDCYIVLSELDEKEFVKELFKAKWSILQLSSNSRINDDSGVFTFSKIAVSIDNIEYIGLMESEE